MVNEKSGSTNINSSERTEPLDAFLVNEDSDTFLDEYDYHFSPGDIVAGTVFSLEPRGALIDIGAKTAAYIPIQEMSINRIDSSEEILQQNETREFFILADENEDGQLTLSIRRIEYMRAWERLRQIQAEDVTIRATVFATNQGGALVRVEGLRGFIPGSHISTHKPKEELVGEELLLKFLEVDEEKNRLVLSHRRALVERKMNRLEVGEVVSGTVRGIKPYGAFIDIGGVSALLPVSEISHVSIENPGNVFQVNDEVKVIILDLDAEKGRISVSTKALELEPGDMLRNPQQVYEHAEEVAARYLNSIRASSNLDQDEEIGFYDEEIISYEQALQEISQEQFPEEWAATQVKLANTYLNRTKGERAENLEQAIAACESALQIYTCEALPEGWANTQLILARAYFKRIRGNQAENIERAINAYQLALQVFVREHFPEDWATTQVTLGLAYSRRLRGDSAENWELAIQCYRNALNVFTPEAFPIDWANAQKNLALAYTKRFQGERSENLELAIRCCQSALSVYSVSSFPYEWASIQHELGNIYLDRIRGDRAENIEQAMAACEFALQVYTREAFPEEWAQTQSLLATVYAGRMRGDRAENLEQEIAASHSALQFYTRDVFPEQRARAQNDLAKAYSKKIRGDRAENLEQAINNLLQALEYEDSYVRRKAVEALGQIGSEQAVPGLLQSLSDEASDVRRSAAEALGKIASSDLRVVNTSIDLLHNKQDYEVAIALLGRALQFHPDNAELYMRQGNLRSELGRYEDAIANYNQAIAIEPNLAEVWSNRGNVLATLRRYEEAIASYDRALEIQPDLSTAWNSRGVILAELERYEDAIACYERALALQPDLSRAWDNRGEALDKLGRYEEAFASFDQALQHQPDVAEIWNHRGNALKKVNQHDALPSFNRAIELKPYFVAAIANRGDIYRSLSRYEEALQDFNRAIEIEHQEAWLFAHRGQVFLEIERYEEALIDFNRAIELDSNDAQVIAQKAQALAAIERYEEARQSYENALAIFREKGDRRGEVFCLGSIGSIYQLLQQDLQAIEYFERALIRIQGDEAVSASPEMISLASQVLLASSNPERAIALAQAIPNVDKRFDVLRKIVERVYRLEGDRAEEFLSPLRNDSDERIRQVINRYLAAIEIFISYSKQDKELRDGLLSHLRPLEREGLVTWHDRQILPGTQWNDEIKARLNSADIILLLISADFLATDYCTQVEIPEALKRHQANDAIVMPVILRSCAWQYTPLATIQAYPEKAKPIKSWSDIDEAYTNVLDSVYLAVTEIKKRRNYYQSPQPPSNTPQHLAYCVYFRCLQDSVSLGSELEITVALSSFTENQPDAYLLEISRDESLGNELNILVTASGFQFDGNNTASLPLDLTATELVEQTVSFHLLALRPGFTNITAELYRGDTFEATLEKTIQVFGLDESTFLDTSIKAEPRPVSQPDLILQVQTLWNEAASTCTFRYYLRSFRASSLLSAGITYQSQPLSGFWLQQVHELLQNAIEPVSDALPADGRSHLTSLGHYLFQQMFPTELQADLRNLNRYQANTLLILADQDAQLPWTLLHNGQEFLGERFILGHWLWDLNNTQPYEFPVGAINVAHYANVEQPEVWATLLEPPGAPPPYILTGGVLDDLGSMEAMRGLHLIRLGQSVADAERQDAPVPLDVAVEAPQDIDQKVRPIKLNLRRNRPLVTLGYLRQYQPELTSLQQTWAATFIRAGCSAFVGTLWAVNPATEAAFISSFYHALWTGDSLGGAFQTARRLARATTPDSLDWLAYLLFGDPMARPYRPVQGQGYTVVEPIGQDIDDPVPPGTTIRFRVSLRRTPPVWHEERVIEVAENLTFNDLQAHIVTFGLQVTPTTSIPLRLTPSGNYLGWFNLSVPSEIAGDAALVQVYFADGMQTIHTLTFPLTFQQEEGHPA